MNINSVDIFCEVIDNYGDIGVAYRFARELFRVYPNKKIRFIVNKTSEINLIKKSDYIPIFTFDEIKSLNEPAELVIETFACNIPEDYMSKIRNSKKKTLIINLEYFSCEEWVDSFHLQESFMGENIKKFFYIPGLSEKSGGLILDKEFLERTQNAKKNKKNILLELGFKDDYDIIGSIFSYEKNFDIFIEYLKKLNKKILLFILSEKTQKNFIKYFDNNDYYDKIEFVKLPFLTYDKYEELLAICDFNFVRGEDSLGRALLLGVPFLWHIYPQEENIHLQKLNSFLELYCPNDMKLKKEFLDYNLNKNNFSYFFENYDKIKQHNIEYSKYLIKNCNLIDKFKTFIENIGGN